jgi:hypothetical protein
MVPRPAPAHWIEVRIHLLELGDETASDTLRRVAAEAVAETAEAKTDEATARRRAAPQYGAPPRLRRRDRVVVIWHSAGLATGRWEASCVPQHGP